MSSMFDSTDEEVASLNKEVELLERELALFKERQVTLHDTIKDYKEEVRKLGTIDLQLQKVRANYNLAFKALEAISTGSASDPVDYARKKLNDLDRKLLK